MRKVSFFCFVFLAVLLCVTACAENTDTANTLPYKIEHSETILPTSTKDEHLPNEATLPAETTPELETSPTLPGETNNSEKDKEMINNCKLIVAGYDISDGNYIEFHEAPRYVALPFTAVLKALGAQVEWKSEFVAEIEFNEAKYTLDTREASFVKEGSNTNCIIPAPGSQVHYQVVENEFVLDHITLRTIAMILGITIRIDIDYQNYYVLISYS